jgi:hypothetical protein
MKGVLNGNCVFVTKSSTVEMNDIWKYPVGFKIRCRDPGYQGPVEKKMFSTLLYDGIFITKNMVILVIFARAVDARELVVNT